MDRTASSLVGQTFLSAIACASEGHSCPPEHMQCSRRYNRLNHGAPMFIAAVTVHVKPEFVEQFIPATLDNATNTRKEPGNIRFDVAQAIDDPARFLLYEVYHTPEDFKRHQE